MIPSFSLREMDFSAFNGKYSGILNFVHIVERFDKNNNNLHGTLEIDGKAQPVYATFEYYIIGDSLVISGVNDADKEKFNIRITPVFKMGKTQLKIEGTYGPKTISTMYNPEFNKLRIAGSVVIDSKEYPINIVLSSTITGTSFKITGVNNLDKKVFIVALTPKLGIGNKCKIEGTYGAKILQPMIVPLNMNAIMKLFDTLKTFVI